MKSGKEVKILDAKTTPIMMNTREPTIRIRELRRQNNRILGVAVEAPRKILKMSHAPIKITKNKIKIALNNSPSFIKNSANLRITKTIIEIIKIDKNKRQEVNNDLSKILISEMMTDKGDRQIQATKIIISTKIRTKTKKNF